MIQFVTGDKSFRLLSTIRQIPEQGVTSDVSRSNWTREVMNTLLVLVSVLLALVRAECPAKDRKCRCSVKLLGLRPEHYITCSDLGTRTEMPPFGPASQPTEELRVRSGSAVATIQADAFNGLRLRNLKLSSISLQSLSPVAFRGEQNNLVEIYLADNNIKRLDGITFSGLQHLKYLGLQGNSLERVDPRLFSSLNDLVILHLSSNELRTLPANVFAALANLRRLFLQDNRLATLPQGVFDPLVSLNHLALGANHLQTLPDDAFKQLTSLESLHLDQNELRVLKPGLFEPLTQLAHLDLAANNLADIPDHVFQGCRRLSFLSIANNRLAIIRPGMIEVLHQLRILHLQVSTTFLGRVC